MIFYSCRTYIPQHPKIGKNELPIQCAETYDSVKENWVKFRKSPCHRYFSKIETFASMHKDCIIQLNRGQVEQLFGLPDKNESSNYTYVFRKYCPEIELGETIYFQVIFDEDKVSGVDAWLKVADGKE